MIKNETKKELEEKLEYCKKQQMLAVIFFDGEDRRKINFWKQKRKEVEEMLKEYEG